MCRQGRSRAAEGETQPNKGHVPATVRSQSYIGSRTPGATASYGEAMADEVVELQSVGAWEFFQDMLRDVTAVVTEDAQSERERLEGLRAVSRISALCAQLSVEADADRPSFFDMCTPNRMVGGPNPDGNYYLAMIRGDRSYRITGQRGTSAYLGLQILAGTGLNPRRMAGYVSDRDLILVAGQFNLFWSAPEPADLRVAHWVRIPEDASSVVVREYIGDRNSEELAELRIEPVDADPIGALTDVALADPFTAMAWTLMKLAALHRTIKPELLSRPNALVTAQAADLGDADTTPDNLYMIGTFRLEPGQALVLHIAPPAPRSRNGTLDNILTVG